MVVSLSFSFFPPCPSLFRSIWIRLNKLDIPTIEQHVEELLAVYQSISHARPFPNIYGAAKRSPYVTQTAHLHTQPRIENPLSPPSPPLLSREPVPIKNSPSPPLTHGPVTIANTLSPPPSPPLSHEPAQRIENSLSSPPSPPPLSHEPVPWRITFDTNPDDCNLRCMMCEEHSIYSKLQEERKTGTLLLFVFFPHFASFELVRYGIFTIQCLFRRPTSTKNGYRHPPQSC